MNEDYTTHDLLSEYAESAKKIRASQRFRAETLRKIRYQAAMHPETQRAAAHRFEETPDTDDFTVTNSPTAPKSHRRSSVRQKIRSLASIAASLALIGGMGLFLYRKASATKPDAPGSTPDSSDIVTTSQVGAASDVTKNHDEITALLHAYQKARANCMTLATNIRYNLIEPLTLSMNPPNQNTQAILDNSTEYLNKAAAEYRASLEPIQAVEEKLRQCQDVVIYDVYVNSDSSVTILLANGTDSEISVSRGCSVTFENSTAPISDQPLSLEKSGLKLPPNSTQSLLLSGFTPGTFTVNTKYRLTLVNVGYRAGAEDPGTREFVFTHTAEAQTEEYTKAISEKLESEPFDYGFSENLHAEKATLDDVQAYLQKHHNIKGFIKDYEPTYTFSSNLWSFSPYQSEIGDCVRRIWILEADTVSFVEELDGKYHLIQPDTPKYTINPAP